MASKSRQEFRATAPGDPPDQKPVGDEEFSEGSRDGSGSKPARGLYVVPTPIGNLRDITLRALDILQEVELIACEDTRVTARLLDAHGITTPVTPYHEHNARRVRPELLRRLAAGASVALVSDAGTPLISDPGYRLVREATEAGHPVTVLPGPSAVLTALAGSALPTDRFLFAGFPPPRSSARKTAFRDIATARATLVFFESARRIAGSLADMRDTLGDREAVVAREMTKRFEEFRRGTLSELAQDYARSGPPKGEVVIVVAPPGDEAQTPEAREASIDDLLREVLPGRTLRDAVDLVAGRLDLPRRAVYERALAIKNGPRQ
jgi:16S rRNA (cytidine1402-2'-O)-methyltransferase